MKRLPYSLGAAFLLLVSAFAAAPPPPADLSGTWHWTFTMPDGTKVAPKLKLKQEGDKLTGTSSVRSGTEIAITNGVVNAGVVHFEVVRHHLGIAVTTRYSGQLDGKFLKGHVESDWAGQAQSYPWEARRYTGIEGLWKWTNSFGGRQFESRLTLSLEGEQLTGSMPGREGRTPTEIQKATFKDNEIVFEVERGRGDFKFLSKHRGVLQGDVIRGTTETVGFDGQPRTNDWDAFRAD